MSLFKHVTAAAALAAGALLNQPAYAYMVGSAAVPDSVPVMAACAVYADGFATGFWANLDGQKKKPTSWPGLQ